MFKKQFKKKQVVVTPYNPQWPKMFEVEANKIRNALGGNCLEIHHIGSTSIPGLISKPIIDIIAVVRDPDKSIEALQSIGAEYRGEFNIPFHYCFTLRGSVDVNLHVYEEDHPEIELNLLFRDFLLAHPELLEEYARLKEDLVKESSSHEKNNSMFTGYNLGKDAFIRKVLNAANFNRLRFMHSTHYAEWEKVVQFRKKYFFDPAGIADPYTWTFDHNDHVHFVLYKGVEIIGYAHIQRWPANRAALRIFVIDDTFRNQGFGSQFLLLCEKWLKKQGVRSLHDEARPDAVKFYRDHGYTEMVFDDPSGEPPSPLDVAMGKLL